MNDGFLVIGTIILFLFLMFVAGYSHVKQEELIAKCNAAGGVYAEARCQL